MFSTTSLSPLTLHLDEKNPRFRINMNPTQADIREYMITHEDVIKLANKMVEMNTTLPGERIIIFNDGTENIVLEGNRRTCVYQMLLNRNLIPTKIVESFPKASMEFLSELNNISVDQVDNREQAMAFLTARHIEGVKKWSSVSKWKISNEYYKDGKTIQEISKHLVFSANTVKSNVCKYRILLRGINDASWSEEERIKLSPLSLKPDKLLRIFNLAETSSRFGFYYDDEFMLKSKIYNDDIITKLIVLLTRMAFINNEINTRSSINDIWGKLTSEIPDFVITGSGEESTNARPETEIDNNNNWQLNKGSPKEMHSTGGSKNLPYFFEGLQFGHLSSDDPLNHGVARVCDEIRKISNNKMVNGYPIAAAFLTRALIEHSLVYYARKHNVQNTNKTIWAQISQSNRNPQLGHIIKLYKDNLANYILDNEIRDYFVLLFKNINDNIGPLNWVVHKPDEFVLSQTQLLDLPNNGLRKIINYLIAPKIDN